MIPIPVEFGQRDRGDAKNNHDGHSDPHFPGVVQKEEVQVRNFDKRKGGNAGPGTKTGPKAKFVVNVVPMNGGHATYELN